MDLSEILPAATVMVVSVTASTSNSTPLPEEDMASILKACDLLSQLDQIRTKVIRILSAWTFNEFGCGSCL